MFASDYRPFLDSVVYVVSWYALRSGVYAMVGSASMLAGFKQMAVAVVVFITGLNMTLSGVEISWQRLGTRGLQELPMILASFLR